MAAAVAAEAQVEVETEAEQAAEAEVVATRKASEFGVSLQNLLVHPADIAVHVAAWESRLFTELDARGSALRKAAATLPQTVAMLKQLTTSDAPVAGTAPALQQGAEAIQKDNIHRTPLSHVNPNTRNPIRVDPLLLDPIKTDLVWTDPVPADPKAQQAPLTPCPVLLKYRELKYTEPSTNGKRHRPLRQEGVKTPTARGSVSLALKTPKALALGSSPESPLMTFSPEGHTSWPRGSPLLMGAMSPPAQPAGGWGGDCYDETSPEAWDLHLSAGSLLQSLAAPTSPLERKPSLAEVCSPVQLRSDGVQLGSDGVQLGSDGRPGSVRAERSVRFHSRTWRKDLTPPRCGRGDDTLVGDAEDEEGREVPIEYLKSILATFLVQIYSRSQVS